MLRTIYAVSIVALIGSTAWTATDIEDNRAASTSGVGLVLLTALQR